MQTVEVSKQVFVRNGFGEESRDWGEWSEVDSFGWYVTGGVEGRQDGHVYSVEYDAVLLVDPSVGLAAGDRVRLPGLGGFAVSRPPGEWGANPWWDPGLVHVQLKRVGDHFEN